MNFLGKTKTIDFSWWKAIEPLASVNASVYCMMDPVYHCRFSPFFFSHHYILITASLLKVEYKLSSLKLPVPLLDKTRLILAKTKSLVAALWSSASIIRGRQPKLCG